MKKLFVGTWSLISCEHRLADGSTIYPFGKDAHGILIYTADGYMSGALSAKSRPRFHSKELFGGSPLEKSQAAETYLHYAGRYEVEKDRVLHHVEMSLFPNWVGSTQKRKYRFYDDKLDLSVGPFIADGIRQTAHLLWKKA